MTNVLLCTALMLVTALPTAIGAEPTAATTMLEDLRAANAARAALAAEEARWQEERDRLHAVLDGMRAQTARLAQEADDAQVARDRARADLAALGASGDLEPLRAALAAIATTVRERLTVLAQRTVPGAVNLPAAGGDAAFDDALRALDASERAAGTVAVEVLTGDMAGQTVAVKVLRVGGAAAWWLALDGTAGGSVRRSDGATRLEAVPGAHEPIARAVAIAEGRHPAELVLLPAQAVALEGAP